MRKQNQSAQTACLHGRIGLFLALMLQDSLNCFLQVLYCFFAGFCTWMNDGVVVHTACSLKGNQMYGLCSDAKIK